METRPNQSFLKIQALQKVIDSPAQRRHRRYQPNEQILIAVSSSENINSHANNAIFVNISGFPEGMGTTVQEQQGPFIYALAIVLRVHFDEHIAYYTVRREDTNDEFRADAVGMFPITTQAGSDAARKAAEATKTGGSVKVRGSLSLGASYFLDYNNRNITRTHIFEEDTCRVHHDKNRFLFCCWNSRCCRNIKNICYKIYKSMMYKAELFLKGQKPFFCSLRLTGINIVVLCSIWFAFVDMLVLSYTSPAYDHALSIVNCVVWFILMIELMLEVFIRPDGYQIMLRSEKAYSPITARFINGFHLWFELFSLLLFLPPVIAIFRPNVVREAPLPFYLPYFSLKAVLGPTSIDVIAGRAYFGLIRFRIFGLIRHWKKWVNTNMIIRPDVRSSYQVLDYSTTGKSHRSPDDFYLKEYLLDAGSGGASGTTTSNQGNAHTTPKLLEDNKKDAASSNSKDMPVEDEEATFREKQLVNATSIGTALMTINSHRLMLFGVLIAGLIPIISLIKPTGNSSMVQFLQDNNVAITSNSTSDCAYLKRTIGNWLLDYNVDMRNKQVHNLRVLWLQVLPVRCPFQKSTSGVITSDFCYTHTASNSKGTLGGWRPLLCTIWENSDNTTKNSVLAKRAGIRVSTIQTYDATKVMVNNTEFVVSAKFNEVMLFLALLLGLEVLRLDAGRLVLNPFRSMLKIVSLYAKKPLAPPPKTKEDTNVDIEDSEGAQLGKYETEQLINAITKITDLLRKCWGVAGASIITANLARQADGTTTELNPCVPGTRVYALFCFAALCNFEYVLKNLGADILILINDVANVLHGEVYRWGFGESGQCNKNLGAAFLFVFRIGAAKDVQEKKERATEVIFSTSSYDKKRYSQKVSKRLENQTEATTAVQLHSLPGIQEFSDRAVIGLLKCFAGLNRNQSLLKWGDDFRLTLGHGRFSVDMVFGMHAGWAVEGAVGSEYKIDATYLSPHVNMAARMMTACKQYGVSILLTEAIEHLMSKPARELLRQIDTVTVKGSTIPQRIYTYDMRHEGVDFFLFEKTSDQADIESDRYSPLIWLTDQDLMAMRQHVTPDFEESFKKGIMHYLKADWVSAYNHLKTANDIMVQNVSDMGYIPEEPTVSCMESSSEKSLRKNKQGDGPSRNIIAYIKKHNLKAPRNWKGFRALTSK